MLKLFILICLFLCSCSTFFDHGEDKIELDYLHYDFNSNGSLAIVAVNIFKDDQPNGFSLKVYDSTGNVVKTLQKNDKEKCYHVQYYNDSIVYIGIHRWSASDDHYNGKIFQYNINTDEVSPFKMNNQNEPKFIIGNKFFISENGKYFVGDFSYDSNNKNGFYEFDFESNSIKEYYPQDYEHSWITTTDEMIWSGDSIFLTYNKKFQDPNSWEAGKCCRIITNNHIMDLEHHWNDNLRDSLLIQLSKKESKMFVYNKGEITLENCNVLDK